MPVTPFHFGPGALVHAVAPRWVSFLAFAVANVITDVEPLYDMVMGRVPLHRFLHTYVGASVVLLATWALCAAMLGLASLARIPDVLGWT